MKIQAIKTRKFLPPKDNLWELLEESLPKLEENSIVIVTSKIVSIAEGRCVSLNGISKDDLAKKEADFFLERDEVPGKWFLHTLKNNHLIASSGIDQSNANNYLILWPKNPEKSVKRIWEFLRKKYGVANIGVIVTDSHSVPLHRGLVGMAIAFFGFEPLRDYRGKKDVFGKKLLMSQTNIPDSLASAAVFTMGEGSEQTPIAIISELSSMVKFSERHPADNGKGFLVTLKDDLFYPFLKSAPWKRRV